MFDRQLLRKELTAALTDESRKDVRPMKFTWGLLAGITRLAGVAGAHVARSHDHLSKRADSADNLFTTLSIRIDRLEQKLSAAQKQIAALQRKSS